MKKYLIAAACLLLCRLAAEEYFVRTDGDDGGDGSRRSPFRTIGRGVDCLKPGDTLTIGPGEYFESVERKLAGEPDRPITIRAEMPGSVLIRGDRPVRSFTRVPGRRFVYVADWDGPANAVNERNTLKIHPPAGSPSALEFTHGGFYHDRAAKKLYLSCSDGGAPEDHELTVSVLEGSGLLIAGARHIRLHGIAVTGFYAHSEVPNGFSRSRHGILLQGAQHCVISECTAFLNSNGIILGGGSSDSVIEHCVAYANGSNQPSSGGNIISYGSARNNIIRHCRSFFSSTPGDQTHGIRFYSGKLENCLIEHCVSFGEGRIYIKGTDLGSSVRHSYAEGGLAALNSQNNIYRDTNAYNQQDKASLQLDRLKRDAGALFADPDNHDFRPQHGATGVKQGWSERGEVFFLAPDGDDAADGRSLKSARKTPPPLRPGSTLYLSAGSYRKLVIAADGVTVRTRGAGNRAVLENAAFTGSELVLTDLDFTGPATVRGDGNTIRNCRFSGPLTAEGQHLRLTHNDISGGGDLTRATGFRHSNFGAGALPGPMISLDDGVSFDALPLGAYRLVRETRPDRIHGPFVRSVTDTTVNLEWWSETPGGDGEFRFGENRSCPQREKRAGTGVNYHTRTLSGLPPGKTCFFQFVPAPAARQYFAAVRNRSAAAQPPQPAEVGTAKTADRAPAPRVLTVGAGRQFAAIADALEQAVAGDTVEVGGGVYAETLYFRSGGDQDRPITLKAAVPGEAVIDGGSVESTGIRIAAQSHLRINGFTFRHLRGTDGAAIRIDGGRDLEISRCFHDGRSVGYTPCLVRANGTDGLTLTNSVAARGFHGAVIRDCPRLLIRNCVWYVNQINHLQIRNAPDQTATVEGNIFIDTIPMKYANPLIGLHHLESLRASRNCYYLRRPENVRTLVGASRIGDRSVAASLTYEKLLEQTGGAADSVFLNPQLACLAEIVAFRQPDRPAAEWPKLMPDHQQKELKSGPAGYARLDIRDFIAGDPTCRQLNIGLEPGRFGESAGDAASAAPAAPETLGNIAEIDRNFRPEPVATADGVHWYSPFAPPFRLAGFCWAGRERIFRRLPLKPAAELPKGVERLAWHTSGGIVKFRTDSTRVLLRGRLRGAAVMPHMPRTAQSGFDLYVGAPGREMALGAKTAATDAKKEFTYAWWVGPGNREFTLNLPLYDGLEHLEIGLNAQAALEPPSPYAAPGRIVLYGSSTIQGACVSRPGHGLSNRLSRMLNREVVNLGFSGSGLSEEAVARVIASTREVSLFVLSPDSNTSVPMLNERFPRFVALLREQHPAVPILVVTRHPLAAERFQHAEGRPWNRTRLERSDALRKLVEDGRRAGDRHLHFRDGQELLGEDFDDGTVDGSHLGDLGFRRLSESYCRLIREILPDNNLTEPAKGEQK